MFHFRSMRPMPYWIVLYRRERHLRDKPLIEKGRRRGCSSCEALAAVQHISWVLRGPENQISSLCSGPDRPLHQESARGSAHRLACSLQTSSHRIKKAVVIGRETLAGTGCRLPIDDEQRDGIKGGCGDDDGGEDLPCRMQAGSLILASPSFSTHQQQTEDRRTALT